MVARGTQIAAGQGVFEIPGMAPETPAFEVTTPRDINWQQRISVSSLIQYISDVRALPPDTASPRELASLTPEKISSSLYVPEGLEDREVADARGGIIFPADEFKLITTSPLHVGRTAAGAVRAARRTETDKAAVESTATRASLHALETMHGRAGVLVDKLDADYSVLALVSRELASARRTGFFAHFPAAELKTKLAAAETAIFDALDVAGSVRRWTGETHERARHTLEYQLFGSEAPRRRNWAAYTAMVGVYARRRRIIAAQSQRAIEREIEGLR